jgi:solute carrier family 15 oligopeptide transporter 1
LNFAAILVLYLTRKLLFDDDTATILYHSFTTLVYFCCVIGAIIADSWWGKFHTILWLSMVYVGGSTIISFGAIEVCVVLKQNLNRFSLKFLSSSELELASQVSHQVIGHRGTIKSLQSFFAGL